MIEIFVNDTQNREAIISYARGLAQNWQADNRDKTVTFIKNTLSEHRVIAQATRGGKNGRFKCVDTECKFNVSYLKRMGKHNISGVYSINCDEAVFQPYHDILCTSSLKSQTVCIKDLVENVKFQTWVKSKSAPSTKDLINYLSLDGLTATKDVVKKAKGAIVAESHSKKVVDEDFKTLPAFLESAKDLNHSMEYDLTKIGDTSDKMVVLMPGANRLLDVCHPIVASPTSQDISAPTQVTVPFVSQKACIKAKTQSKQLHHKEYTACPICNKRLANLSNHTAAACANQVKSNANRAPNELAKKTRTEAADVLLGLWGCSTTTVDDLPAGTADDEPVSENLKRMRKM